MRRVDQYDFTIEYDKTFLTGHLKGLTVHVKYGTCSPGIDETRTIFTDCMTGAEYTISGYRTYRNW